MKLARPGGRETPWHGCPKTAILNFAYASQSWPEIPFTDHPPRELRAMGLRGILVRSSRFSRVQMRVAVSSPRAVFLELSVERAFADAQDACGFFSIAAGHFERLSDVVPLDVFQRLAQQVVIAGRLLGGTG